MTPRLQTYAAQHLEHLNTQVLPWWFANGSDDVRGGVYTCFDNAGELVSTDKYTWSQGRWAWLVGAIASEEKLSVFGADQAAARAARTADFLVAHAVLPDGSTIYQLTADGEPIAQADGTLHASIYADLFLVLGLAGAASAHAGSERAAVWTKTAQDVLASASERIRRGEIRSEPYPVPEGMTSLAVGMMMLSASTALYRATGASEVRVVATSWAEQLIAQSSGDGLPAEFVAASPRDTLMERHRTPGHVLELLWFLIDAGDALPDVQPQLGEWCVRLAVRSLELGWDTDDGGLFRFTDRDGGPPRGARLGVPYEDLVDRTWSTKLWWPHAESLYTTALLADRYESDELLDWHERLRDYTYAKFPDPNGREWIQIRDRHGEPVDQLIGLPVKDPFHVARSLLLIARLGVA